ncbi:MAG: hypothetical protein D6732_10515, partial [Methanobacteriota archaeon]
QAGASRCVGIDDPGAENAGLTGSRLDAGVRGLGKGHEYAPGHKQGQDNQKIGRDMEFFEHGTLPQVRERDATRRFSH